MMEVKRLAEKWEIWKEKEKAAKSEVEVDPGLWKKGQ